MKLPIFFQRESDCRWRLLVKTFSVAFIACVIGACSKPNDSPQAQIEVANTGVNAGSLSSDGSFAVIGTINHGISFWRTTDKERLFDWSHQAQQNTVLIASDFSSNSDWALTADVSTLVLWRTNTGHGERYWQAPGEILDVALSPDAHYALLGLSDHTAVLFDVIKGGVVRTLHHNNRVRSVVISRDGKHALTGSEDFSAIYWDLETGQAISKMQHQDDVQLVQLSDDGSLAFSVSKYDSAILWRTQDGQKLGELPLKAQAVKRGLRFTAARFNKDNTLLVTGRPDQIVTLWEVEQLQAIQQWEIPKRKSWKPQGASIIDVAFHAETAQILCLSSNGFISYLGIASAN